MLARLQMWRLDVAACLFFIAFGLLAMYEGYQLGSGWGDTGPAAGFFPFILAVLMVIGGVGAGVQALRRRDPTLYFEHPQEIVDLLKVGIPMAVAIASVQWLGLYLMAWVYLWLFSWWYGRHPWWLGLGIGIATSVILYYGLQVGFRINMPHSIWYRGGFIV